MLTCNIAIAGFGRVGRATAAMLLSRRERYKQVYGTNVRLVAVCGSQAGVTDRGGLEFDRLTGLQAGATGPGFIDESDADILIEAAPSDFRTGAPGLSYIEHALAAGRDAIVISKGALVHSGPHLRDLARRTGATLKISGATAAALPTIDLLDYALAGCSVTGIEGILNATTNYLLEAMIGDGIGFDEALAKAQLAGFTESDPRQDIEGWDTACKLLLLANFGLGANLSMADLDVHGIQSITRAMVVGWREAGLVPKLVGRLWYEGDTVHARVALETFARSDPLAHVTGKNKGIRISTDTMGDILAIGCGSEPDATAAAALKDLEHILANRVRIAGKWRSPSR